MAQTRPSETPVSQTRTSASRRLCRRDIVPTLWIKIVNKTNSAKKGKTNHKSYTAHCRNPYANTPLLSSTAQIRKLHNHFAQVLPSLIQPFPHLGTLDSQLNIDHIEDAKRIRNIREEALSALSSRAWISELGSFKPSPPPSSLSSGPFETRWRIREVDKNFDDTWVSSCDKRFTGEVCLLVFRDTVYMKSKHQRKRGQDQEESHQLAHIFSELATVLHVCRNPSHSLFSCTSSEL
jgi:hypothetical protein